MTITDNDIGKNFTLAGAKDGHTYTLVWFSDTRDACGVIPSWSRTGWVGDVPWVHGPAEYTVRTSMLRPLTSAN